MALEASRLEGVPTVAGGCCLGALPTQAHVPLLESCLRAFQVKRKLFHGFFWGMEWGRDGDSHIYKSIAILTWWWGEGTKLVPKGCGLG